jgi:hypothetical protein
MFAGTAVLPNYNLADEPEAESDCQVTHPDQAGALVMSAELTAAEADALQKADLRMAKKDLAAPGANKKDDEAAGDQKKKPARKRAASGPVVLKRPAAAKQGNLTQQPPPQVEVSTRGARGKLLKKRPSSSEGGPSAQVEDLPVGARGEQLKKRPASSKRGGASGPSRPVPEPLDSQARSCGGH